MAQILVDFENVICCGVTTQCFTGINYLNENDTLYLFYSSNCPKIRAEYFKMIKNSGCQFKLCKLVNTGKNALDFYIVTEIGRLIEQGEKSIAVISNDNGYKAVIEYVAQNPEIENDVTIVLSCSIESTLGKFKTKEDKERWSQISKEKELIDLDSLRLGQYSTTAAEKEEEKCVTSLGEALKDITLETKTTVEETVTKEIVTEESPVESIKDIIEDDEAPILEYKIKKAVSDTPLNMYQKEIFKFAQDNVFLSPNDLYKKSIHIFGRKNGTEISRILRILLF